MTVVIDGVGGGVGGGGGGGEGGVPCSRSEVVELGGGEADDPCSRSEVVELGGGEAQTEVACSRSEVLELEALRPKPRLRPSAKAIATATTAARMMYFFLFDARAAAYHSRRP